MLYRKDILNLPRDNCGRIILDSLIKGTDFDVKEEEKGKRDKCWYILGDDKFLLKKVKPNTYEDYAELIVEELCKQMGMETAEYDIATLGGEPFVISWNMLKGPNEKLISGKTFSQLGVNILETNGLYTRKEVGSQKELNNLLLIEKIFSVRMSEEERKKEIHKMDLLFALSSFCVNGDLHLSNWSVIYDKKYKSYRVSPNYDSGSYFRFNLEIQKLSKQIRNLMRTHKDTMKRRILEENLFPPEYVKENSLNYSMDSTITEGVARIEEAFEAEPERFAPIIAKLLNLDAYQALSNVQDRLHCDLPDDIVDWVILVTDANKEILSKLNIKDFVNTNGGGSKSV